MLRTNEHITFFLGAGFSKDAGAPTQGELLNRVLEYSGDNYGNPVKEYKARLYSFLEDAFNLSKEQMQHFSLEDFYTPVDKCISENSSFRGYSVKYIKQVRNELSVLISIVLDAQLVHSKEDKSYLETFIWFLYHNRRTNKKPHGLDFNIITTNWDILLDSRIYTLFAKGDVNKCIDYGTEVSHLQDQEPVKGRWLFDRFNPIRLYKIHGSLNWLKCPSCNRLYVNPLSKIGILEHDLSWICGACDRDFRIPEHADAGLALEPQIIYPTFLKDFSNIHFNKVWDKASVALTESRKLVFIGYSFQQADYEIRQLLSRKVPDDCEIICVLNGAPPEADEKYWMTPEARYKNFFGQRRLRFSYIGAREWILKELPLI